MLYINTILLSTVILTLCIALFVGNRYFKGWVAFEIYKTNQILVDKIVNKDAFKYFLPSFTELPDDTLEKETVQIYYRDMYALYGMLYVLNKQGMLFSGEWEALESCLKGNISQNKCVKDYAQMIVDGRRVWPEDFQLYIKDILDKHNKK